MYKAILVAMGVIIYSGTIYECEEKRLELSLMKPVLYTEFQEEYYTSGDKDV